MSRVTVSDLVCDYEDEYIIGGSGAYINEKLDDPTLDKISRVEIVPRKMVEKIIEKCERLMNFYTCDTDVVRGMAYDDIRAYAESLLEEFEEDK